MSTKRILLEVGMGNDWHGGDTRRLPRAPWKTPFTTAP